MAKTLDRLRRDFEYLWSSPDAYRPPQPAGPMPRRVSPVDALYQLAEADRLLGATAGDVTRLAVELLSAIDEEHSYARAFDSVVDRVASGEVLTVIGHPMRDFLSREQIAAVLELVAIAARPQAYEECGLAVGRGGPAGR